MCLIFIDTFRKAKKKSDGVCVQGYFFRICNSIWLEKWGLPFKEKNLSHFFECQSCYSVDFMIFDK